MSTRCCIGFYDGGAKLEDPYNMIYKHWDGYPESVLPVIDDFMKLSPKIRDRDNDPEYQAAWFLWYLINEHVKANKERAIKYPSSFTPEDGIDGSGHGICFKAQVHGDENYYYAVYPGYVEVYSAGGNNMKLFHKTDCLKFEEIREHLVKKYGPEYE